MNRIRVYLGISLDGYIAGPEHDLAWLNADYSHPEDLTPDPNALRFPDLLERVGAMVMGRNTFNAVHAMDAWPYGDLPVLVATHRPIEQAPRTVEVVTGPLSLLLRQAQAVAGSRDVYLDGGEIVRQALREGLVDEITLTIVPILLGGGIRLFDELPAPVKLQFTGLHAFDGGMAQLSVALRKAR